MPEIVEKIRKISDAGFRFTGHGRPRISSFGTPASSVADADVRYIAHLGKLISGFGLRISVFGGNMFPTIGNEQSMSRKNLPELPVRKPYGSWVQTERAAHEAWAALITRSPIAARAMHVITAQIDDQNAFIISQEALADLVNCSERRLRDAIKILAEDNWIEVRRIGGRGTVNAYVVNDRVAWNGSRDGLRYSLFSAKVYVPEREQPDREELGNQAPLRRLPSMFAGEQQLPSGEGLPPISQPALEGFMPDLPARRINRDDS